MTVSVEQDMATAQELTKVMLHELQIAIHRHGYMQLCIGIPRYAQDSTQGVCKELYPYIADELGCTDWHAVERSIRFVILDAWDRRDPNVWDKYFPNFKKAPSNKQFIATLADRLK